MNLLMIIVGIGIATVLGLLILGFMLGNQIGRKATAIVRKIDGLYVVRSSLSDAFGSTRLSFYP